MFTSKCNTGDIFLCNDKCSVNNINSVHNYLIIGRKERKDTGSISFYQAMSITSMSNKDIEMEVPIKLCNGMISYIVPYNLHSFLYNDIIIENYKGTLTDSLELKVDNFINFLLDIYFDSLGLKPENHDNIVKQYKEYCDNFWKKYPDSKEFRDNKVEKEIVDKVQQRSAFRKTFSDHKMKTTKEYQQRKDNDREVRRLIQTSNWNNEIPSNDNTNIILNQEPNEYNDNLSDDDIVEINNFPKSVSKLTDDAIIKFSVLYKKIGCSKMLKMLGTERFGAQSTLSCYSKRVNAEAESRNLQSAIEERLTGKVVDIKKFRPDIPIRQWSNTEVKEYYKVLQNHLNDDKFMLEYSGCKTIEECHNLNYAVKRQRSVRNLI